VYDNELKKEFPPLVYCEDLESTNGTYVNDECIGIIGRERIGHLLSDGDIVEIKPFWRFRFQQPIFQTISRSQTQLGDLQVCTAVDLNIHFSFASSTSKIATQFQTGYLAKANTAKYIWGKNS
jgi:hypothetical protein